MDKHFADVYEAYYKEAFSSLLSVTPQFHRVIPVNVQIKSDVEILPEDDVIKLIASKKAWAVLDCVCRTEQRLLGKACGHPIKVCLALSDIPGAFDNAPKLEALDMAGALAVLEEAAEAGLVHTILIIKKTCRMFATAAPVGVHCCEEFRKPISPMW